MARIKVATSTDVDNVQTQVTNIDNSINQPAGISERLNGVETEINNTNNIIGADDTAGLRKRITDNETAIGDANSGIIKGQNDLVSVVGADNTAGLQKRVVDLEVSVGLDDATGLRKDSVDLKAKTDGFTYDDTAKRITQVTAPVTTAAADTDLLTKKDGDTLYPQIADVVSTTGFTMTGAIDMGNNNINNINRCLIQDEGLTEGYHIVDTGKGVAYSGSTLYLMQGTGTVLVQSDRFKPSGDDKLFLGDSGNKWKRLYCVDATINTSDARLKNRLGTDDLDKLSKVWFNHVKVECWQWKTGGKVHFGPMAQQVVSAFEAAELKINEYSLVEESEDGTLMISPTEVSFIESYCVRKRLGL